MIDSKELRLGNLVSLPSGISYSVDVLYKDYTMLKVWNPIPITEEWLLKLGFGKSNEHERGHNTLDIGFYYDWHFKKLFIDTEKDLTPIPHIKYIHQLQNIFYSLTGEELTIKQ